MGNILYPGPSPSSEKKQDVNHNTDSFIYAILEYDLKRMDDMSMVEEKERHGCRHKKRQPMRKCRSCSSLMDKDVSISDIGGYTDETMSAGGDDIFKDIKKAMNDLDDDKDTMSYGSDYSSYGDESL